MHTYCGRAPQVIYVLTSRDMVCREFKNFCDDNRNRDSLCVLGPEIDNWQEWRSLSEKWRRKGREELFCFWWNEAWGGAIWLSSDIWCNLVIHSFTITTISLVTYRYNAKMRGEGEDSLYEGQKQKLRCCFIYWLPKVKRGCHITLLYCRSVQN